MSIKNLYKSIKLLVFLSILSIPIVIFAQESDIDVKISKILKASVAEKEILLDELKNDISKETYNKTELLKTEKSNKSIDEKITLRRTKSISKSKCGMNKCWSQKKIQPGVSHGSKCGSFDSKCGGDSHGSKCGSGKCGTSN